MSVMHSDLYLSIHLHGTCPLLRGKVIFVFPLIDVANVHDENTLLEAIKKWTMMLS